MAMFEDGSEGQVENVKDRHYCMGRSVEAKNNEVMNRGYKYNAMDDAANTAHPPTPVKAASSNKQLGPKAEDNDYNYNADRG